MGQPTALGEPPGCYGLVYQQPGSGECKMGTGQPRITETEYCVFTMEGRLEQPTKHAFTPANTLCVAPTQRGSALSIYILRAMFLATCSLRTGTHDAAQPTRRQQPPTARATATHRSPNRSRCHRTLQHRECRRRARPGQPVHTHDCRARQCSAGTPATDTAAAQPRKSGQKLPPSRAWRSTWYAPCRRAKSPPAAAKPVARCPQEPPNLPQPNQRPAPTTRTRQQANAAKKAPVSATAEAGAAYRRMTATPAGRDRGS